MRCSHRYQWTPAGAGALARPPGIAVETTWGGWHSFFLNSHDGTGSVPKCAWTSTSASARRRPPTTRRGDLQDPCQARACAASTSRTRSVRQYDRPCRPDDAARQHHGWTQGTTCCASPSSSTTTGRAHGHRDRNAERLHRTLQRCSGQRAHQEVRVEIVGHTSAAGSEALQPRPRDARAEAVRTISSATRLREHRRPCNIARGEAEADPTQPRRASDRAELVVDGGGGWSPAGPRWGHAFGLDGEYVTGATRVGDPVDHDAMDRRR